MHRPSRHRAARRSSGGVIVYIRNDIASGVTFLKKGPSELVWIKLDKNAFGFHKDILICVFYAIPSNSSAQGVIEGDIFDQIVLNSTLIRLLLCVEIQMGERGLCLIMLHVMIVGIYRFLASMLKTRFRYILELIWTLLWMPRVSVWLTYARCVTWGLWMVDLGLTKGSVNIHAIHITDRVLLVIIYVALTCFSLYVVLTLKIWICIQIIARYHLRLIHCDFQPSE